MIGKKIKQYRQQLKLTGATLANLAGINQPYLSQIENEKKVPPFDTFMDLVNGIAKISPLNDENKKFVLTEDRYQEFKALLKISVFKKTFDDIPDNEVYVSVECVMPDDPDIEFDFIIEKTNIKDVTKQDIDKGIRKEFFEWDAQEDLSFSGVPVNLASDYYFDITVYEISDVREALYEWWYNHILKDFVSGIDFAIDADLANIPVDDSIIYELKQGEVDIINSLFSIRNADHTFTPLASDKNINLSKELLEGRNVTFDLLAFSNKNVRLLLDGQLLTNPEMTMLKVALDAIKYNRQKNKNTP